LTKGKTYATMYTYTKAIGAKMQKVKVISVEDAGYYSSEYASGSTVKVTLQRGKEIASCTQILIWDEEYKEDCFEEWRDCALAGEEGYTYKEGA
jgi:hypothetical protein